MSEQSTIPVGTLFRNRYQVESVLGKGGFGNTYVVHDHERFKRKCVLKELLSKHDGEQKIHQLFEREARTLDRINHPGIPRLEAFFVHEERYYLVEAFVEGATLAEILEKQGALPESQVVKAATEMLEILKYLHGIQPPIIHRDIKPSNLMLANDGRYMLIDFGAVREAVYASTAAQGESTAIGTPGYMPPEQYKGHAFPASDLYALGATLLHLLTGRPPLYWYDAHEGRWTYRGKIQASSQLLSVLDKLLADLVPQRYGSAEEVLRDLTPSQRPKEADNARQMLIDLIDREGHQIVSNFTRCEALMLERAGSLTSEVSALLIALKQGVPQALLNLPTGLTPDASVNRLTKTLSAEHGLAEDRARWAVLTWKSALESPQQNTKLKKLKPDPDGNDIPWKKVGGFGAVVVAALVWYLSVAPSVEVQSIKLFAAADGLADQVTQSTPVRSDYKSNFRSDEPPFIYYDLRLAQPAHSDIALDILWLYPDGAKVTQERSIKAGAQGTIFGRGSKQGPPNWKIGRYVIEFSWHGKKLGTAEFNVSPAPEPKVVPPFSLPDPFFPKREPILSSQYDIPSLQANVVGQLRFYEGPRTAPPVGSRFYRTAFSSRSSRWIWCEINVANAGTLSSRNFAITAIWYRNGTVLSRANYDFTSPAPRGELFYSISYGSDRPSLALGTYTAQIYVDSKLLRTGSFTIQ